MLDYSFTRHFPDGESYLISLCGLSVAIIYTVFIGDLLKIHCKPLSYSSCEFELLRGMFLTIKLCGLQFTEWHTWDICLLYKSQKRTKGQVSTQKSGFCIPVLIVWATLETLKRSSFQTKGWAKKEVQPSTLYPCICLTFHWHMSSLNKILTS